MPYGPEDYATLAAELAPTPERVATAKAWLAERISAGQTIRPEGLGMEFASDQGVEYPYTRDGFNPQDPTSQDELIPYWQQVLALRQAIYDLHQDGIIVPVVQGHAPDSPSFFNTQGPSIALGAAGQQTQVTPFPTLPLNADYAPSMLSEAERQQRLELYDADLYVERADLGAFDERARRCVSEALACYRNDLFLAAANMLGAASEAVWHQLAESMVEAGVARNDLREELGASVPRIARIQQLAMEDLRQLPDFHERFGVPRSIMDSLAEVARFWRDLRNYGMHPAGALAPETFSQAGIAVELMGAAGYFSRLAGLLRGLARPGGGPNA